MAPTDKELEALAPDMDDSEEDPEVPYEEDESDDGPEYIAAQPGWFARFHVKVREEGADGKDAILAELLYEPIFAWALVGEDDAARPIFSPLVWRGNTVIFAIEKDGFDGVVGPAYSLE